MRGRNQPTRPSREVFQEALDTLKHGKIPSTMPFVASYINNTTKELLEYSEAMTECAFRLDQTNKVLREMATSFQQSLLRAIGRKEPDGEESGKDYSELIVWLGKKINYEQECGRQRDAEMLTRALDAVLLLAARGKGKSE